MIIKVIKLKLTDAMYRNLIPEGVVQVLQNVMDHGERKGKRDIGWTESIEDHIEHAREHLDDWYNEGDEGEDHLAHAFTRLMMAVSIEKGLCGVQKQKKAEQPDRSSE